MGRVSERFEVWIDQDQCTGDGLCAQYAPEVFEIDIDALAYVKDAGGTLLTAPGARAPVPAELAGDVAAAVNECPGACIFTRRAHTDDTAAQACPSASGERR
ncbi:MAG: ferredoxin [Actinomycetia bacterium]|nr:ferredoxin [Actinomycetes bacterium]